MRSKILVVDDDDEIRNLLEICLSNEGFSVVKAFDGEDALNILDKESIQLIILDVMMPKLNGMEVCSIIRRNLNIPILMLSAKSEDMDKIQGIMTGADDYLTKPFNSLELIVRVKALLRRSYYFNSASSSNNIINIDTLTIDKNQHRVAINEEEIPLTSREFDILYLLAVNRGSVLSSEDIFRKVWKEDYFQSNNTVMVHMSRIRDKIEKYTNGQKIIHTVWGVGYKIEK
ncbi:transcriptional regulatory family protein [[Clostridium] bifermentans ATCC 638]|uniref:Stage 0 sporulation protein A homolog n=2 Tax=Bacillota TaxID=1239 RepID=T4VGP7_PARBF|nr:response regulator transcription factor [Paraclostridium bifermentans]EQK40285.1 transcriptional regulatory family protein [[Clostridium] bifermentans ATCC 638] [Paraclostridium bifermentans ATCC 638 = DSM 14991]RIZ57692.1 DNA-binding response regulator [Paraclostridium bifermentans]UAG20003.1 response regulator transcription factor [Paraclostridium bifermentans]